MSSKPATFILGHEIQAFPHRLMLDSPPHVCVHKLGETRTEFFTPTEARAYAAALLKAADEADGKE